MKLKYLFIFMLCCLSNSAWTAEPVVHPSPTGSLFKMILGLMLVLGLMAGVAYLLRRMLPGVGHQYSTVHIVGSASVGTRERVVVLEVGDRWLVVGVAPGQVSAIANLEKGVTAQAGSSSSIKVGDDAQVNQVETLASSFRKVLKNSTSKFTEKAND